jgi:subtilisin family serine protease
MMRLAALIAAWVLAASPSAAAAPGPYAAPEYWFDDWQVPRLWADGARGAGITIAEIDAGVNASLSELRENVLPGKDFTASGGDAHTDHSLSRFGHGTAMASIMVAHPGLLDITGLAPDAKLLPIAIPLSGTSDAASGDHLAEAIRWAADNGAKIISMSLGGVSRPSGDSTACPVDEQDAILHALDKGVVLFAAAGNRGTRSDVAEEPGVCLGVVSVGAVDRDHKVASFSSRHPYLTMTAPGVNIPSLSRVPGAAFAGDGTSEATALTAAAAALVWSKYPGLTGRDLVTRLLATLDDRRRSADPAYGYGILDAGQAVRAQVPSNAPNPVYDAAAPFLDRRRALAPRAAAPVPPASLAPAPPGTYRVGEAPERSNTQLVAGLGLAVLGAAGLLVLAVAGVVRTRRRPPPLPPLIEGA